MTRRFIRVSLTNFIRFRDIISFISFISIKSFIYFISLYTVVDVIDVIYFSFESFNFNFRYYYINVMATKWIIVVEVIMSALTYFITKSNLIYFNYYQY